jgi:deoxyribonuclease V
MNYINPCASEQWRNTEELYRIQEEIASQAVLEDELRLEELKLIAGADQAFLYHTKSKAENGINEEKIISVVVVLEYPSLKLVEYSHSLMPVDFPYIPGLLSFREAPVIIRAFHTLKSKPDLLVIDGCGINHPRFAGLATHVGVILDVAAIGVAKNLLCGTGEVPNEEGEARIITYQGRAVGYYLKSKKGCKPIIIAPGHKMSLKTTLKLIKTCIHKHKLPEPIRIAHCCANKIKKDASSTVRGCYR